MKRAIIIEDEEYMRAQIRTKLATYFSEEITVVAEASSVETGLQVIQSLKPDLLLLDIEIHGGSSFDILAQLQNQQFQLIFITGFNHLAIKAIKVGALDYVLKPIDDDEFIAAVNKTLEEKETTLLQQNIEASYSQFKGLENKKIVLKTATTFYSLLENDIIYCKADGNYTHIYVMGKEKIVVSKTLRKIEELLSKETFLRCHNSYIINKNHIEKYTANGTLITKNNLKIPVSSRKKDTVLKQIFK